MTQAHPAHSTGGASRDDEGATAALGLAGWLRLAATPTFAIMALLTGLGGSPMDSLCSSGHGVPLSGMVFMYLLMSAFHSPPWLSLICGPRDPRHLRPARDQSSRQGRRAVRFPERLHQKPV
ncbi:MAG TPA: hypothetical protein VJ779_05845 [Acetobacteraceae bacterium]|nr:hypothetical protein [Acetobacteraceae bacterium]